MSRISIIIPCFHNNIQSFTNSQKCIERVKDTVDSELIIVENIERFLSDEGNIYLGFKEPRSYAENFNSGLKLATGDYICSLNNDLILPDNWFNAIKECFEIPHCGVATIESSQYNRPPEPRITEDFFGGVWVMKREVFEKVGYLDETFRHAFDDADYWVRVYQAGYKILMNKRIVAEHKGGATIYGFENHTSQYVAMRKKFNEKYKGCNLPIFERLR